MRAEQLGKKPELYIFGYLEKYSLKIKQNIYETKIKLLLLQYIVQIQRNSSAKNVNTFRFGEM